MSLVRRSWRGIPDCNVRPYKPTLAGHTKSLQPYQPREQRDIAEVVIQTDLGLTAQMRERHLIRGRIFHHSAPGAIAPTRPHHAPQTPSCLMPHGTLTPQPIPPLLSGSPKLLQYATYLNRPPCIAQLIVNPTPPNSPPAPHPAVTTKLESTLCHQKPFTAIVHIGELAPVRIPP